MSPVRPQAGSCCIVGASSKHSPNPSFSNGPHWRSEWKLDTERKDESQRDQCGYIKRQPNPVSIHAFVSISPHITKYPFQRLCTRKHDYQMQTDGRPCETPRFFIYIFKEETRRPPIRWRVLSQEESGQQGGTYWVHIGNKRKQSPNKTFSSGPYL